MALSNYSELRTSVINRSGRNDSVTSFDDYVAVTEEAIRKHLRVRFMEGRKTLSGGSAFIDLPDDFMGVRRIIPVYQGVYYKELTPRDPNAMARSTNQGIPGNYTITSQLELDCVLLGQLEFQYYKKPTGLSASNTTNDILTNYPSVYLYGCLADLFNDAGDEEEELKYRALFSAAVDGANEDYLNSMGSGRASQVEGSTP